MKIYLFLFCWLLLLGGCTGLNPTGMGGEGSLVNSGDSSSISSRALLTCLNDTKPIGRQQFEEKIKTAEAALGNGQDADTFHFICLSLNAKADYEQFKHGAMLLEQYLEEHADAENDLQGFLILVDQLDIAIRNKWTSWKTLLNDKKALKAEVASLKAKVEELQEQIDQLKNIENIIKSRE